MTIRKRNLKSFSMERFQKSRKMERVNMPYEDPLYEFCKDLEKRLEKKGVLCELYIEVLES